MAKSVKVENGPSTTGKPSGGGRGNKLPSPPGKSSGQEEKTLSKTKSKPKQK